jgi:hypothetical protein
MPLRRFLLVVLLVLLSLFTAPLTAAAGVTSTATGVRASGFAVCASLLIGRARASSVTATRSIESLDDGSERRPVTRPDALAVATVSMPDGTRQTSYVDGTVVTVTRAPDPHFGMQAPFAKEMTIATGGYSRLRQPDRCTQRS